MIGGKYFNWFGLNETSQMFSSFSKRGLNCEEKRFKFAMKIKDLIFTFFMNSTKAEHISKVINFYLLFWISVFGKDTFMNVNSGFLSKLLNSHEVHPFFDPHWHKDRIYRRFNTENLFFYFFSFCCSSLSIVESKSISL